MQAPLSLLPSAITASSSSGTAGFITEEAPNRSSWLVQLRFVSPQHDMYSIRHNTLCSTTVKCMTDTQLYCLKFMFLVYTYAVCTVILAPMEHRPWQFNTYARTYVRRYIRRHPSCCSDPGPPSGLPSRAVSTGAAGERCGTGTKACSSAPR